MGYYQLPKVEIENYIQSDAKKRREEKSFGQVYEKKTKMVYDKLRKIATSQGYNYRTECLLGYPYLKQHVKIKPTSLGIQQVLDANYAVIYTANKFDSKL